MPTSPILHPAIDNAEWWRTAVIYQIYPRSFADANGDGVGDLPGVTAKLQALAELGVDAIWFSPFFKSPQKDAGYDVSDYRQIDPIFGTNEDLDALIEKANSIGLKIIVDIVPNHTSDQHAWFQAAIASDPGSPERAYYHFRDGDGKHGELPPNNWQSIFGGSAWSRVNNPDGTLGQWYLHLFDSSQPDLNWENEAVAEEFYEILRFWLRKGVAGFRVDVAHGMVKAHGLPNADDRNEKGQRLPIGNMSDEELNRRIPYWIQPGVHEFIRNFRKVADEFEDRALCAEASVSPLSRLKAWVRPDEYHQTFNFDYMETPWIPRALRDVVTFSLAEFGSVGAASTWVLSNHDGIRHATKLAYDPLDLPPQGDGIGPDFPQPDEALGIRRARAATAFMLGLPGSAYLFQGEELGLPEHTTLESKHRQDPTFTRTKGARVGRDGCRVPLPWVADATESNGFNTTGKSWLPQPANYRVFSRNLQDGVPGSTLELYKRLLKERKVFGLGAGEFRWAEEYQDGNALAYINNGVLVLTNFGAGPVILPAGELLVTTQHDVHLHNELEHDQTVWIKL